MSEKENIDTIKNHPKDTATEDASNNSIVIIDASIFIFRYYFSMLNTPRALLNTPQSQILSTSSGRPTETVYGYSRWLKSMLNALQPKYVAACFDESLGQCFRNDIYPEYKSSRSLPDDDLAFQLLACKRMTQFLGIPCFASPRYEADDLIASIAWQAIQAGVEVKVLTHDKDLMQLLGFDHLLDDDNQQQIARRMVLWNYPKGDGIGMRDVYDTMGVHAYQIADYLALVGDPGDDVPGVPGVGKKTAAALLQHYHDWPTIKANIENLHTLPVRGAKPLATKLGEHSEQVDMALRLTTVVRDAVETPVNTLLRQTVDAEAITELAEGLGFPKSFYTKL